MRLISKTKYLFQDDKTLTTPPCLILCVYLIKFVSFSFKINKIFVVLEIWSGV